MAMSIQLLQGRGFFEKVIFVYKFIGKKALVKKNPQCQLGYCICVYGALNQRLPLLPVFTKDLLLIILIQTYFWLPCVSSRASFITFLS